MPEIRRCHKCAQPALTCVREWQHVFMGITTPSKTLELACQACGHKVTLEPHSLIKAMRLGAYLLLPAIFPSVYFFARARRMARAWTDNPVVSGAIEPATISPDGVAVSLPRDPSRDPRDRTCRCGSAAPCVKIIRKRMRGIPIGTRHEHACTRCASVFHVYDGAGIVFAFVGGLLLLAVGLLIVVHPPGAGVGAERDNRVFGFAVLAFGAMSWLMFIARISARSRHPRTTLP